MYNSTPNEIEQKDVSERIAGILRDKVKEHNDKDPKYRATFSMLRQVFERGVGAYNTNPQSVRPNVTSSDQWALARVNTFIRALSSGKFPNRAFDTDLLPAGHPKSTKKEIDLEIETKVDKVPSYIQKNAQRGLDLLEFAAVSYTHLTLPTKA